MKLSEAIRLGRLCIEVPAAGFTQSCAIGMALWANGRRPVGEPVRTHESSILFNPLSIIGACFVQDDYEQLVSLYPWIPAVRDQKCPWCTEEMNCSSLWEEGDDGTEIIFHPFDEHVMTGKITLDALCDWLATLEPQEEHADGGPGPGVAVLEVQEA